MGLFHKLTFFDALEILDCDSLSAQQKKKIITVPFNRQQMADYLSVDRSALSNELSKMQKEGILEYHKESFKLLKEE